MRRRGVSSTITASPTMVGAVTTLIVIVAVFLAYNANAGLPFVPVYRVSVEVPDAARLTNNNEVRIGGHRVGVVESIDAIRADEATATAQAGGDSEATTTTGGVIARLNLKLDKDAGPLPKDSIFRVRYRSSFGLKYLEIIRGEGENAPEGFTFDGTDDSGTSARCRSTPTASPTRSRRAPGTAASRRRPSSTTSPTPSTRRRATNARTNLIGLRQRLRRPRHLAQRRDPQPASRCSAACGR